MNRHWGRHRHRWLFNHTATWVLGAMLVVSQLLLVMHEIQHETTAPDAPCEVCLIAHHSGNATVPETHGLPPVTDFQHILGAVYRQSYRSCNGVAVPAIRAPPRAV